MFQSNEVFNGSIPPICMMQILRAVDFSGWHSCYVGCSGTFTFERAIGSRHPHLEMHGNDVSLLSGALAGLALNKPLAFRFTGRLESWEERLAGRGAEVRLGALVLALFLGRVYGGPSEYARRHFAHYEAGWDDHVTRATRQAIALVGQIPLKSYFPGDFREHLRKGMEAGAGVIVSAPFIEGWYEKWFRFIHENIEWDAPSYDVWRPDLFPALLDEIDASGVPYVAVYREELKGRPLVCYHRIGMKPKFYVYSRSARASVVDEAAHAVGKPFRFKPVDIGELTADTKVEIVKCKAGAADYIKGLYLQENIPFTSAPVNFLVYLDGALAGILSYSPPKYATKEWGSEYLYLLSDTATTRFGRVSKLIAMLALSKPVVDVASRRLVKRGHARGITTTVRSNAPVSMKYRGPYRLLQRREAGPEERSGSRYIINYGADVRDEDAQTIYGEWFKRYFKDDRSRTVKSSYAK